MSSQEVIVNRRLINTLFQITGIWMLLILNLTNGLSQTYYFDTYSATEGASSKIFVLYQDQKHYIWLGTLGGVSRFDGISFDNFTSENGLAAKAVRTIFQDSRGIMWFGHEGGGLSLYRDDEFIPFNKLDTLIYSNITAIFEDSSNQIWITTAASGVFVLKNPLDETPLEYIHFVGRHNLSDRVFNYCITADSSIYLISDVGIRKYNEAKNIFEVFHPKGLTTYFSIANMFEDRRKNLWFGTYNGGLYKYDTAMDSVIIFDIRDGLSSNWISAVIQDRNDNMWIGTWGGGVTRINDQGLKIYNAQNGLEASQIFSIIEDVEGNILIGSSHKGLAIFKGDMFENYGEKEGLRNKEVYAIIQDGNKNYWIGTNNGITVLDKDLKSVVDYYVKENSFGEKLGIQMGNKIRFLRLDKNNNIWIGTEDQRVLFYDAQTGKFKNELAVNNWFARSDYLVSAMEIDKENQLWIGTIDGLLKYDIDKNTVQRFSNSDGLIGNEISAIFYDDQNQTWVGANGKEGICKITGNEIKTYPFNVNITPSCMIKDHSGNLWIGTKGKGIKIFNHDTIIGTLGTTDGLLSNLINTLNIDKKNNLYIGTDKGLNVYNQDKKKIHTYSQKNGFIGIETNPSASFQDSEGNIWFGTNQGVNKFNTKVLRSELVQPLIHLEKMVVNQEERRIVPDMHLKFFENHITFIYKSICLTNSDAVRYRVMLEGIDKDWHEVTTQTSSTYQALQPNKYTFKVIARNSDGIWNSEPLTYRFQILIPFYKRWYFIFITIIILFLSLIFYIKLRERNLIREKKILEGKVKERTIELQDTNEELEEKNRNITDSIRYAQRIQMSILPPEIPFNDMFVLFKPKDIVSGDFYWIIIVDNKELIAAVDCTGHGVPGAFMSFIGYSSLNEVVKEKGITKPAEILDQLNNEVVIALNLKGEEGIKDGMDLALISYDNLTSDLEYAGAYNPLYLVRNGELNEIKADRFAIGKSSEEEKHFSNHSLKIKKGDTIYLFSDGYADQFGGEKEKKFKTAPLKRLLISIQDKSMEEQKEILDRTIEEWRGNIDQIDDILFIGRRF